MRVTMRQAAVILGMHRSGTSAVTGAVIRLGLTPPRTPLAPTLDNLTGFHEPLPLTGLNDLVLKFLGCSWHDCLTFDPVMLDDAAQAAALQACTAILREEFVDEPAFVVKDPRLCLTLPIWLPAFRALDVAISFLLVVRHPEEVAKSVFWRDMLPEAETAAVWLHHTLEAERMTRGAPRAVVLYTDLLDDWRGCMARAGRVASLTWPDPAGLSRADDDHVVLRSLRHHIASTGHANVGTPPLRDMIDEAWQALRQLADNPASSFPHQKLDALRSRFARWRTTRTKLAKATPNTGYQPPRSASGQTV
jgi:hypothetical protein